ncbi:MAG: glycogen synthase [Solirubrobacteraceae bacterium]|jgi:glycosyltransferase involved in cell wall biosynthesis|nr:glycogen synthase [Solirubrobacteraceae bacterium]
MRILTVGNMYPPHHLGGYELLWEAAVEGLRAVGHDVRVLTTDYRDPGVTGEDGAARELRWYWQDRAFPERSARERRAIERHNRETFARHVDDLRPDVVSFWAMGGMSLSLLAQPAVPCAAWVIDAWPTYAPAADQALKAAPPFDGVDDWVFCSVALRTELAARIPELARGVVELPGVAPTFSERPTRDWAGQVLYVGRIDERKGIATAVEALAALEGMTLRVVGPGDVADLRALAGSLGVSDRVEFVEAVPRDRLAEVYATADVTLFPVTWFEPFGLVPLEAMAVGRPVVATGTGGSGDYLRDGENALLHAPGDAAALAACVRRLAGDAALRERLRDGGLVTASHLTEARWLAAVVARHEALVSSAAA